MKVSRGDVVLVDYPFSDRKGSKVRPALIVQSDALNYRIDDTILASISRSTHRASNTQLFIDISSADGATSGLRQDSMVQCEILLTYDQGLIYRDHRAIISAEHAAGRCLSAPGAWDLKS